MVDFEKRENLGILTFNNPKRLNIFDFQVLSEFDAVLDIIKEDLDIYCVIIAGSGEKAFIAGGDIKLQHTFDVMKAYHWSDVGQQCLQKLEDLPMPVICAVNGYALGGGTETALACDLVVASENAIFGLPEVKLGIIPGFGGTQRLPQKVGVTKAKELMFTGAKIDAAEAQKIGLVNKVVPHETLMEEAIKLAEAIIRNAPIAVRLCKVAINEGMGCDHDRGLTLEKVLYAQCFATEDSRIGMKAFMEKNKDVKFRNV